MRECYILMEFGGEYEDKWEKPLGVYLNMDKAQNELSRLEAVKGIIPNISEEIHDNILDDLYEHEVDDYTDITDPVIIQILDLYGVSPQDWLFAKDRYSYYEESYYTIETVKLIE